LATIIGAGFLSVWGVLGLYAVEIFEVLTGQQPVAESVVIRRDGEPLIASRLKEPRTYRDLEGNPVHPASSEELRLEQHVVYLNGRPPNLDDHPNWGSRVCSFAEGPVPTTFWYLMSDGKAAGTAYFAGYDSESKYLIGYIGIHGFQEEPVPVEDRFPIACNKGELHSAVLASGGPGGNGYRHPSFEIAASATAGYSAYWDVYLIGRDHAFYHVDLRKRSVDSSLHGTVILSGGMRESSNDATTGTNSSPVVRTDDAIILLDSHGHEQRRYPIPELVHGRVVAFSEANSGDAWMYTAGPYDQMATEEDCHIFRVHGNGQYRQTDVTLARDPSMRVVRTSAGFVAPSPVVLALITWTLRTSQLLEREVVDTPMQAWQRASMDYLPALLEAFAIAAVCAVICYRRQVRFGASGFERIAWPIFVLFFGLPGWIGYRFGRTWPVLETCPSCDTSVPRDREECVRCAEEFSSPALRGTEVFA
jgi:hypothetical protein